MTGSRVAAAYELAAKENRAVLVGYLPAGFPSKQGCIDALTAMVSAGVDVVEVGLPYSDPVLDGPVIQAAADQALAGGTRIADVFATVEAVAATGAATVVMTYWNPVLRYGVDRFARDLAAAGGQGLITPDLTPDFAADWLAASDAHGLDRIFLAAPSTSLERLKLTVQACRGFVYATAVMGVTGARTETSSAAPALVARLREVTDLPLGVGLGVSNGEQAAEVASYADGVIVGSAFVRCLQGVEQAAGVAACAALSADLAAGVRRR
ncbi:MAG: tryptophan synthase subunit alpha [Sporichthyaceae bacterium]